MKKVIILFFILLSSFILFFSLQMNSETETISQPITEIMVEEEPVKKIKEEQPVLPASSFTEIPRKIEIKDAVINQELVETGLNDKGEMEVGETAHELYAFKPPFNDFKNLLVSGHKDWKGSLGTLFYSDKWDIGTELVLTYENGDKESFILSIQFQYKTSDTPAELMDLFNGQKRVTVITCTGNFVQGSGYEERIYNVFVEKEVVK